MSRIVQPYAFLYGLVHESEQCFKIGYAVSMDARAKKIGIDFISWKIGVTYLAVGIRHAREVEGLAHRAMEGWRLSYHEVEETGAFIPAPGATEWFSTKGFSEFLVWLQKNKKKLGIRRIPFHETCSFAEDASSEFYRNASQIAEKGLEPKGRSAWLARIEYWQQLRQRQKMMNSTDLDAFF